MVVQLSKELEEIRVTGGEPLMTLSIYKLFDWFKETDEPNAKKYASCYKQQLNG